MVRQEKMVVRRTGLQSASLECINGNHIIRQRYFFLLSACSALGFAPDSPRSARIALPHRILLKPAFRFEVKIPVSTKHPSPEKKTFMKL